MQTLGAYPSVRMRRMRTTTSPAVSCVKTS